MRGPLDRGRGPRSCADRAREVLEHTVAVLPEVSSLVLIREPIYTAITRATERTTLFVRRLIRCEAIARPIQHATDVRPRAG